MQQNSTKQLLIIALKLLVICTIVAGIEAFVNHITYAKIEYNGKVKTAEALSGIYSVDYNGAPFEVSDNNEGPAYVVKDNDGKISASCEETTDCELVTDVTSLYVIRNAKSEITGYCVAISPMGFKDKINMLVAINPTASVRGVKIVSLSETSGIGTKVQAENFLEKFVDKTDVKSVDTISGATKSSKPVINAVENALKQVKNYLEANGGAENE